MSCTNGLDKKEPMFCQKHKLSILQTGWFSFFAHSAPPLHCINNDRTHGTGRSGSGASQGHRQGVDKIQDVVPRAIQTHLATADKPRSIVDLGARA